MPWEFNLLLRLLEATIELVQNIPVHPLLVALLVPLWRPPAALLVLVLVAGEVPAKVELR